LIEVWPVLKWASPSGLKYNMAYLTPWLLAVAERSLSQFVEIKNHPTVPQIEAEFTFKTDQSNLIISPASLENRRFVITQV
jgi:hypothetical protein